MLGALLVGGLMMGVTVLIHSAGTVLLMRSLSANAPAAVDRHGSLGKQMVMILSAGWLLLLHVIEIAAWAFAYLLSDSVTAIKSYEDAFYFSSVTFSTLGYGDIVISDPHWKLTCGLQAVNGILLCGWSTALLFVLVQHLFLRHVVPPHEHEP
ncbi:MAG: potassium channel family protein [Planctomycetota bacterium]